jgi:hypothetical protein
MEVVIWNFNCDIRRVLGTLGGGGEPVRCEEVLRAILQDEPAGENAWAQPP